MSANPVSELIASRGLQPLAEDAGVTYQAVRKWERTRIPAERVLQLVRASNGRITPNQLRPDLYPDPDWLPPDLRGAA